ncbi:MAG TPA: hypothetical protein VMT90_04250 [Dehalococcoidia bacterium]|nr:hypothetical protein [Dehalococcoidia bacterium]
MTRLPSVNSAKSAAEGERVTFRAKVLRLWDVGGLRMCLVGDATGLTRVELGAAGVAEGGSYEFVYAGVRQYPGGWTSISIADGGAALALDQEIETPQEEAYIERTFKILSGIQRKKGRREGRLPPWRHPAEERDP